MLTQRELESSPMLLRAYKILRDYPETRESRRTFYVAFYETYYKNMHPLAPGVPLQDDIDKLRQKCQKQCLDLRPSKKTKIRREKASRYYASI